LRDDGRVHPTAADAGFDDEPVWLHEPARWRRTGPDLALTTDPGTDFWRHTHYGFVRDDGHFLGTRVPGEFVATVEIDGDYRDQYDQAGLMVRLDAERWVKAGVELVDGRHQMSTVVTHAVSDWSMTPLGGLDAPLRLRLTRAGDALSVEFSRDAGATWALHRIGYLPPDLPTYVGPMAASPQGQGFEVVFRGLRLTSS
jgi:regulation of enolase protein 1 (concanavalin A-like superfamily)